MTPTPTPAFEELAIALIASNFNPTLLTPDFLKYSGIVGSDWKLAEPMTLLLLAAVQEPSIGVERGFSSNPEYAHFS
ncbi:hypothetical protein H6F78_07660 [Coleofasciculus sp. FACHB-64]|uniref:hypothetical protein n=1 Tax=Cyanophyceae TaxID=3028117 RepID=UPI001685FCB2|nr:MULTISPECIES: hypothetical protein [unclassified Coleofasciculus]MBD1944544.1 hypothetical protein [Coleofasciculus sp. FACHB-712]MBD2045475.1 hypothetical protein [Coleofasciculus sp. FACHB-64]